MNGVDTIVLHLDKAEVRVSSGYMGELTAQIRFSGTQSTNCATIGNRFRLAAIMENAAKLLREPDLGSVTVYGNAGEVLPK